MTSTGWNPRKMTAIGLGLVVSSGLIIGVVVGAAVGAAGGAIVDGARALARAR
jgi:hypothetical protein